MTKRNINLNGNKSRVVLTQQEGRWHCELAPECHYTEHAVYGNVVGSGETQDDAIKDFMRRCVIAAHQTT